MLRPFRAFADVNLERLREKAGERATGIVLALVAELVLVLGLLSLGSGRSTSQLKPRSLVSINVRLEQKPKPREFLKAAPGKAHQSIAAQQHVAGPVAPNPASPAPVPSAAPAFAIIPVSQSQLAAADIRNLPHTGATTAVAGKANYGPPNPGGLGDTKSVGTAPNGQPLYVAAWYREPYDSELSGYLSTADAPGWALIACRTVPEYRVEDCVGLDEYPNGSNIQRSVLAAAWQFRVRPPRLGGVSKYGEWVRIRIDYGIKRAK